MKPNLPVLLEALRPSQWVKNALVAAGFVFALADRNQSVDVAAAALRVTAACALFCLVSGIVYLLNDVLDADKDRLHPEKRHRPVASGRLSVRAALFEAGVLLALSFLGALPLGPRFVSCVAAYLALQGLYTTVLKRVPYADVAVIALGFVLRVCAGIVAARVRGFVWILACTFLGALLLAILKRHSELVTLGPAAPSHRAVLARYSTAGLRRVANAIAATVVLGYAVWTQIPSVVSKFGTRALAFSIPFFAAAVLRYVRVAIRDNLGGAPEKIVLRDLPFLAFAALYLLACVLAWTL